MLDNESARISTKKVIIKTSFKIHGKRRISTNWLYFKKI